jgi:hypothetical protein
MKVTKVGNVYKVARITGPKHNFLGLELSGADVPSLTVERLQVDDGGVHAGTLDEQQLIAAVRRGVTEANQKFGTHFYIAKLQYVVTDTPESSVYLLLAQKIIEAAWRDTTPMVSTGNPS